MNFYKILLLLFLSVAVSYAKDSIDLKISKDEIVYSFENIVKKIEKSIVVIESQSIFKTKKRSILGNGIVVDSMGYIVTSDDLLADVQKVTVKVPNEKKEFVANIVGRDKQNDIAVLKIKQSVFLHSAKLADSSKIKIGDTAFAIGGYINDSQSMTHGIVSAKKNSHIYTDAKIGYENFGGALVNMSGDIIGINSSRFSSAKADKNVAISSNQVKKSLKRVVEEYKIIDAYFGMILSDLSNDLYGLYGIDRGALVVYVDNNKSADNAGIKKGDLITGLDKQKIKDVSEFAQYLKTERADNNITLDFIRNRFNKSVEIKLSGIDQNLLNHNSYSYKGMTLMNITKEIKKRVKIPEYISGVYVSGIKEGSLAQKCDIKVNDIIFQIGHKSVNDVKSFMKSENEKRRERIFLYRNGWNFIKLIEGKE